MSVLNTDRFIVHSSNIEKVLVSAVTESGRVVEAPVPGVVVELIPDGHIHGSVTRRYVPETDDELKFLMSKYTPGKRLLVITNEIEEPVTTEVAT